MKHFIIIFAVFLFPCVCRAQLVYPVVGTYKGKSAQGMAIWGDRAFLFNEGGDCRVLNLRNGNVVSGFSLGSANKKNHVATACFGKEFPQGGNLPALYIAEFSGLSRCFVENVSDSSSLLLQIIEAKEKGENYLIQCWLVDTINGFIYTVSGRQTADSEGRWPVVFRKYNLPKLKDGKQIVLTEQDKLDQFEMNFSNCLQGGCIRRGYMYIVTGFQQSRYESVRAKRSLKIINLKNKSLKKEIDLTYTTTNEPEGFDFFKNEALMFCGQEGGIYKIKYK